MNLHFERRNGYFISEFEVTNDFNLHIEKDPTGQFLVYQRTAGGAYDLVADFGKNKGDDPVIDYDFSALVYPKYIQIKSSVDPVIATITTNGEVNELVYQEKSINITSNGAVAISADAGYNGLAQVNVKVDVPTEGGSSSDDMIYFDYSKINQIDPNTGIYHDVVLYYLTIGAYFTNSPIAYAKGYFTVGEIKYITGYTEYPNADYFYLAFPNKVTAPSMALLGSSALPTESIAGQSMSLYEYLEEINNIVRELSPEIEGDFISIDEIRNAEVTKDEVIAWLNAQ